MAEQGQIGTYRAAWDLMPVLRVFMEAIRPLGEPDDDDSDTVSRVKTTLAKVRPSLRDAVDPGLVLEVNESGFGDAVDSLLLGGYRCEALDSLLDDARRVREGDDVARSDTPASLAVEACVVHHGGDHCSAGQYLLALFHDCRREGRGHCLGVPLLEDGGGAGCHAYPRLDDAARRCLALNGVRCHAADDLDEPDEGGVEGAKEAGGETAGLGEVGAVQPEQPQADAGECGGAEEDPVEPDGVTDAGDTTDAVVDAIWGWARGYNLVADPAAIRRSVAEFGADPLLPEIAYHKAFLLVAFHTLRVWAASAEARRSLSWHFPERDRVEFDDAALGLFHGLPDYVSPCEDPADPEFVCRQVDSRQDETHKGDHRRYEIVFRPAKWNPFEETRADAADRISKAFKRHLAAMLAAHQEVVKGPPDELDRAREVGDVVPAHRVLDAVHARWLVLHQVCGLPHSTIGEIDQHYRGQGREANQLSWMVGRDIVKAAELLLGPRYESWLVKSKPGRPTGSPDKPQE